MKYILIILSIALAGCNGGYYYPGLGQGLQQMGNQMQQRAYHNQQMNNYMMMQRNHEMWKRATTPINFNNYGY